MELIQTEDPGVWVCLETISGQKGGLCSEAMWGRGLEVTRMTPLAGSSSPLGHSPARKGAVGVFLTRTCLAALCLGQTIRTCRGESSPCPPKAEPDDSVCPPWGRGGTWQLT